MLTEQLLDRLMATLRARGVPFEEALAPGTDVSSFTSDDGSLHVELPAELRTWWAWQNGIVEGLEGHLAGRAGIYPDARGRIPRLVAAIDGDGAGCCR